MAAIKTKTTRVASVVISFAAIALHSLPTVADDGATVGVPVEIASPTRQDVPVYLDGLGLVQSENTVNITPQVAGALLSVPFVEGQDVKKGDLLAVIDPRPFRAQLDETAAKIAEDQANLANARYLLDKDTRLANQQIITREELEQQQTQVTAFSAQLAQDQALKEAAEISFSYTEIRSPISGRTGIRQIDAGNQVTASSARPIVTITQTDPISVVSTLQQADLGKVTAAMSKGPVYVTAWSVDRSVQLGTGSILLVDNEIDQATGTIKIKSTFSNPDEKLWPGQAVSVRIQESVLPNALTVPSAALQRGPDGFFLYIVDGNRDASITKVTPGPIENGYAVIEKGLSPSDKVVVTGQYRLSPGTLVSAKLFTSPAAKE